MTKEKAMEEAKRLLHEIIKPHNTEWDMAILSAMYEEDYDWFKKQLDKAIDYFRELQESLSQ